MRRGNFSRSLELRNNMGSRRKINAFGPRNALPADLDMSREYVRSQN